jgi:hypothetical protein
MTQEQKRIKLAEAQGLTGWEEARCLPDYFNDLNAVRELQAKLTNDQQFEFVYHLNDALGLVPLSSPASYKEVVLFDFANATAAQRCEALGLTLQLW